MQFMASSLGFSVCGVWFWGCGFGFRVYFVGVAFAAEKDEMLECMRKSLIRMGFSFESNVKIANWGGGIACKDSHSGLCTPEFSYTTIQYRKMLHFLETCWV